MEKCLLLLKQEIQKQGVEMPAEYVLRQRLRLGGDISHMVYDLHNSNMPRNRVNKCCEAKERARRKAWATYFQLLEEYCKVEAQLSELKSAPETDAILDGMKALIGRQGHDCAICTEIDKPITKDNLKVTKCGHIFHKDCVDPWIAAHHTCPHCRAFI